MDRIKIKQFTKDLIRGDLKWKVLLALLVNAIVLAIPTAFNVHTSIKALQIVGGIISCLCGIALMPLNVGLCVYLLKVVREKDDDLAIMFTRFKQFVEIFLCDFITGVQIFLGYCLFIVPGVIWTYKYCQINNVFADHPEYTWIEARDESERLMDGYKWDYFVFQISFIGWVLLAIVTFGIALIYVGPYMEIASRKYYDDLKTLKGTNPDDIPTVEQSIENKVEEIPTEDKVEETPVEKTIEEQKDEEAKDGIVEG